MSEHENKPFIKIRDNGSILVSGEIDVFDSEGNKYVTKEKFSLCRCGASKNKPFCDGSHKSIDFQHTSRAFTQ